VEEDWSTSTEGETDPGVLRRRPVRNGGSKNKNRGVQKGGKDDGLGEIRVIKGQEKRISTQGEHGFSREAKGNAD